MSGSARAGMVLAWAAGWGGSALLAGSGPGEPSGGEAAAGAHRTIRELRRELLRPPARTQPAADLRRAAERLARMRLRSQLPPPPASAPAASQPTSAPAGEGPPEEVRRLRPEIVQRIRRLPPRQIVDAAALAEALFQAGRAKAAFDFYELALRSQTQPGDQAWLLYQMANCRRSWDASGARHIYKRLVAEHPDSPWAPLAEVQERLIEWYEVNDPTALLQQVGAND